MPVSLEREAPTDGGQILQVTGSNPVFGTQLTTGSLDTFNYQIDVMSDSPMVSGRLYVQLKGNCCDLDVDKVDTTRFLQDTTAVNPTMNSLGRYTIDFRQTVQPCAQGVSVSIVYIVPVLATGGFVDDQSTRFRPEGLGVVDRSHYWTVICGGH